jgi:bifunctional ADP-heptose synthase (sugar kinase/adenylyltransferase)
MDNPRAGIEQAGGNRLRDSTPPVGKMDDAWGRLSVPCRPSFDGRALMKGVVVTGELGLVDAEVVRIIHSLRAKYDRVWVAPAGATLEPAVTVSDLRYALGQLASVERVASSAADCPSALPTVSFPTDLIERCRASIHGKVSDGEDIPNTCTAEQLLLDRPFPLVLLTGCFDLIHAGHIRLIEMATAYGSNPVVALLTPRGIRAQPKNANRNRPLWTMADRVTVLEGLRTKPIPLLFDGPDSLELIERLRPDVWVKEIGDRGRPIVEEEARLVERLGGRVVWEDNRDYGSSTTAIEQAVLSYGSRA